MTKVASSINPEQVSYDAGVLQAELGVASAATKRHLQQVSQVISARSTITERL
jgi:hypothetical protein